MYIKTENFKLEIETGLKDNYIYFAPEPDGDENTFVLWESLSNLEDWEKERVREALESFSKTVTNLMVIFEHQKLKKQDLPN